MKYRADIDGLRALAIIPVILFHAGVQSFSGGFLGVDIFFVISGYLITSILISDLAADKFSIKAFYERRARRILPALFFVITLTGVCAYFLQPPDSFAKFSESAVAAILSVSNILFWMQDDYFNESGHMKPLLHTWSLGIEEQFYIFFPIGLFLIWKFARPYLEVLLIAGFVLSFAFAELMLWRGHVVANFFLLPSRAWELIAGGYIAYRHARRPFKISEKMSALLAGAGLAITFAAMLVLDEATPHPGLYTLIPVLGASAIIAFGASAGIARTILSHRIPVAIGLISYSLYLWHQPVFTLYRYYSLTELSALDYTGLIALSLVLAFLTYKFVETPFRNRARFSTSRIWGLSGAAACVLLLISSVAVLKDGYPGRFSEEYAAAIHASKSRTVDALNIDMHLCSNEADEKLCTLGDVSSPPSWAILGDSHAQTLGLGLDRELKQRGESILFLVYEGCAYLPSHEFDNIRREECSRHLEYSRNRVLKDDIHNVIVMNRYDINNGKPGRIPAFIKSIEELLANGKTVYLLYPVPESEWDIPHQTFKSVLRGKDSHITIDYKSHLERVKLAIQAYDSLHHENLIKIRFDQITCDTVMAGQCVTQMNGDVLYTDSNHLSIEAADLLTAEIIKAVKPSFSGIEPAAH